MKKIGAALLLAALLVCAAGCRAAKPEPAQTAQPTETETAVYTARFAGPANEPVAGCTAAFCTDETCFPVTADENGEAVFTGAPAVYTVKLLSTPTGWKAESEEGQTLGPDAGTLTIRLLPDDE